MRLTGVRGKFLILLNDNKGVRECFGRFANAPITSTYTIGAKTRTEGKLLISNYSLPDNDD
jgi:hypothetical protein